MHPALQGLITIVVGVGGCIAYYYFSNLFLDKVLFPARKVAEAANRKRRLFALSLFVGVPIALVFFQTYRGVVRGDAIFPTIAIFLFLSAVALVLLYLIVDFAVGRGAVSAGDNINRANMVRPWLFLMPALIALGLYLAYPVFATIHLSLTQRVAGGGFEFVGFDNYVKMSGEPKFWEALTNNLFWLIVVPAASTAFGLLAAQLSDRIKWGNVAKSLIFMPMAISFVGAAVIWKLVYDTRPAGQEQIGVMNAVWLAFDEGSIWSFLFLKLVPILLVAGFAVAIALMAWALAKPVVKRNGPVSGWRTAAAVLVGAGAIWLIYKSLFGVLGLATAQLPYGEPQTWLTMPFWNNFFLMAVLVWIQTGFAMVILSAALRGVPEDTIEAAIVDGANPFQIFFQIKVPQIMGTIVVVWTTITIVVLKVFDIVYAMTNGQWETQVLANYMYDKLFRANDWGVGSAAAMVIMLLVTPILVWNVYNARKEMR